MAWVGWISGSDDNTGKLRELGVTLGERVEDTWNDCRVPDDRMDALEVLWGGLIWCLEHRKESWQA